MSDITKLVINTDGGARNNPGPAGIGAVISNKAGEVLAEVSEFIGSTTNNQAEYQALIAGLQAAIQYLDTISQQTVVTEVSIFTDSELMAYQIQGKYKVKNSELQPLHEHARSLLGKFAGYTITPIRREKNQVADKLVNQAIDAALAQVGH